MLSTSDADLATACQSDARISAIVDAALGRFLELLCQTTGATPAELRAEFNRDPATRRRLCNTAAKLARVAIDVPFHLDEAIGIEISDYMEHMAPFADPVEETRALSDPAVVQAWRRYDRRAQQRAPAGLQHRAEGASATRRPSVLAMHPAPRKMGTVRRRRSAATRTGPPKRGGKKKSRHRQSSDDDCYRDLTDPADGTSRQGGEP